MHKVQLRQSVDMQTQTQLGAQETGGFTQASGRFHTFRIVSQRREKIFAWA
jgi:hypothetical protein